MTHRLWNQIAQVLVLSHTSCVTLVHLIYLCLNYSDLLTFPHIYDFLPFHINFRIKSLKFYNKKLLKF